MKRNILLSYIFSITFYFYADLALWAIYVTNYKGFNIVYLGVFQVILILTRLFFDVPSGILADKIGRVKLLIISTLAVILASYLMIIGHSLWVISLAYVNFGITMAFISGSFEAFLFDSLTALGEQQKYKKIYTIQYILIIFSFTAAMYVGAYVSNIDMRLMYVVNIVVQAIALVSCFFMIEPSLAHDNRNSVKEIISGSIQLIKTNRYLVYLIAFISITDALSNNTWHLSQKMLSTYGFSYSAITNEAVLTTLFAGAASILGYYADKRYGIWGNSLVTSISLAIPLIILGLTKNIYLMISSLTLVTMTISFARPIYSAHINAEIDSSFRATTLSIQNLIVSIFASIYVIVLSFSNEISKTFVVIGFLAVPAYIIILRKIRLHKSI